MNNIELKILIGMHRNINMMDKNTMKIASEYGLTLSQFAVLEVLYNKGDMTVGMVRDKILSSAGTIPVIVNNLVKLDYIKRLYNESDRRKCVLSLTEKGRKLIEKAGIKNTELIKDTFAVLNDEEKRTLLLLMKKIGGYNNET